MSVFSIRGIFVDLTVNTSTILVKIIKACFQQLSISFLAFNTNEATFIAKKYSFIHFCHQRMQFCLQWNLKLWKELKFLLYKYPKIKLWSVLKWPYMNLNPIEHLKLTAGRSTHQT